MPWSGAANAGFTDGEPWIKVNPNHTEINVERERGDENSVLSYYRRLIALRDGRPVLTYGAYEPLLEADPEVLAYRRTAADGPGATLVVLNFFDGRPSVAFPPDVTTDEAELLPCNCDAPRDPALDGVDLRPYEAQVYALE